MKGKGPHPAGSHFPVLVKQCVRVTLTFSPYYGGCLPTRLEAHSLAIQTVVGRPVRRPFHLHYLRCLHRAPDSLAGRLPGERGAKESQGLLAAPAPSKRRLLAGHLAARYGL